MAWIDEEGNLTKGRYLGEALEEVAIEDPEYLKWMLSEVPLEPEERSAIAASIEAIE